jgi:hypothetical protein
VRVWMFRDRSLLRSCNFPREGDAHGLDRFFYRHRSAGSSIATAVIGPRIPTALPGSPGAYYVPSGATGSIVQTPGALGALGIGSSSTLLIVLLAVVLIFALRK